MSDSFKPWITKIGAAAFVVMCLFAVVYSFPQSPRGGRLTFHIDATEHAIEFGIDRTRNRAAGTPPVSLLSFSITYWTILSIAVIATILLRLVLLGKSRKSQPKFEPIRVVKSFANGTLTGRGKRLCLEQIHLHLRNIRNIWLHSGLHR